MFSPCDKAQVGVEHKKNLYLNHLLILELNVYLMSGIDLVINPVKQKLVTDLKSDL